MWIPPYDKCLHIIAGCMIFAAAHLFLAWGFSLLIVIFIAAGKEVYDYLHPANHTCDFMDFVFTVAGGLLGFICSLQLV